MASFPKATIVRNKSYRQFVASHPCFGCGIEGYSQCAHANHGKGLGMKTSDLETFPLCAPHGFHQGCHVLHDQCVDMDRDERRELEQRYVERMQAIARSVGRPEFKEAA